MRFCIFDFMKGNKMIVYQYVSLANSVGKISQVLLKNEKTKTFTVLDLEDSLMAPFDIESTRNKRENGRNKLQELRTLLENLTYVGLRINQCESEDFLKDIACLKKLKKVKWNFFILPKIETKKNIESYFEHLPNEAYNRICFLIETKLGVVNLNEILEFAGIKGVSEIHFGMWDYYLSLSKFPFPSQKSSSFWNDVRPIINEITNSGLLYVHTPFSKLLDYKEYRAVVAKVANVSNGNFGITSLTNGQTRCVLDFKGGDEIKPIDMTEFNVNEQAAFLVGKFKTGNYTYLVDENNQFIAPHEFIAAKKQLLDGA